MEPCARFIFFYDHTPLSSFLSVHFFTVFVTPQQHPTIKLVRHNDFVKFVVVFFFQCNTLFIFTGSIFYENGWIFGVTFDIERNVKGETGCGTVMRIKVVEEKKNLTSQYSFPRALLLAAGLLYWPSSFSLQPDTVHRSIAGRHVPYFRIYLSNKRPEKKI